MKRKVQSGTRRSACAGKSVRIPLADWLEEALAQVPAELFRNRSQAELSLLMLAAHEGMLAMAEHFDRIRNARALKRSDLVFRLEVKPGTVGRAAEMEQQARAIEAVLNAATRASKV